MKKFIKVYKNIIEVCEKNGSKIQKIHERFNKKIFLLTEYHISYNERFKDSNIYIYIYNIYIFIEKEGYRRRNFKKCEFLNLFL